MAEPRMEWAFLRFAIVGALGFCIDALVLLAGRVAGLDLYSGRLVSYLCAATFTWYANRWFTFRSTDPRWVAEWWRFLCANSLGGVLNYGTYALLVASATAFQTHPVLAVGVGSMVGLLCNFLLSRRVVFLPQPRVRNRHSRNDIEGRPRA